MTHPRQGWEYRSTIAGAFLAEPGWEIARVEDYENGFGSHQVVWWGRPIMRPPVPVADLGWSQIYDGAKWVSIPEAVARFTDAEAAIARVRDVFADWQGSDDTYGNFAKAILAALDGDTPKETT